MTRYENQTFTKKTLYVDGNDYISCTFVDCGIVYRGGELPSFNRCRFQRTQIQLESAARTTLDYLSVLNQQGLVANVNGVIDSVKRDSLPLSTRPQPCDARDTGTNYGPLLLVSSVILVIVFLLGAAIYYNYIYHPEVELLDENIPLAVEIPLDVMPALPDDLAAVYDDHLDGQTSVLESYGWFSEEDGIAIIPIDVAMELMLEDGLPSFTATGG